MKSAKANSKRSFWSKLMVVLIWPLISLQGCDKLSRTSTVSGRVTEIGASGVDSMAVLFVAVKPGIEKELLLVYTDNTGKYSGTVDVPKGYIRLDVIIPPNGNPKFTDVYRGYDLYINENKTKECCPAKIGGKTQYDFKLYK
ncbi:MAG: hypothetical protein ABIN80_11140 [Dyadobacter sp.]|uniref:hypothetical protein n=1 Tax=Dyadobacter sp. TaxID=1914288 RepID=UPI00326466E4